MRIATALLLIGSLTTALSATANASPASGGVRAFLSPSHNISCELDFNRTGIKNAAYCQTMSPSRSVTMTTTGSMKVCNGRTCIGNPGQGTPTLAYGKSVTFGPFHCSSSTAGVRCVVKSGAGFVISRSSVKRVAAVTPTGSIPS